MKLLRRPRSRTLLAVVALVAVVGLALWRREHSASARPEHRPKSDQHRHREHRPRPEHSRTPARNVPPDSPWASREACLRALTGNRAPRANGVARVGAWNLHWFPDGRTGEAQPNGGTDIEWLACTIAWMQLDVLAIEEIKRPPRGEQGLAELRSKLDGLTGGSWQAALDDCPRASSQHVGLLWNVKRATLRSKSVVAELNPLGGPCDGQLRPGLGGYFGFPGGLDLSLVAAHLKSGADEHAFATRARSFEAISAAITGQGKRSNDHDVLVLGDMNTMGCEDCTPVVSSVAELARVDALFAAAGVPVARVPTTPACSHRYEHQSALLDWVAQSDLAELPVGRGSVVSGVCAELGCDDLGEHLAAQRRLSDHCPIYLDLDDADRD